MGMSGKGDGAGGRRSAFRNGGGCACLGGGEVS